MAFLFEKRIKVSCGSPSDSVRAQTPLLDSGPRNLRVIRQCTTYRRFLARAEVPRMADLPTERVTPSRSITKTGLDFATLLIIESSMSKATQKTYVLFCVSHLKPFILCLFQHSLRLHA